jgi:ABC-2 type transport system ATP-binding protein
MAVEEGSGDEVALRLEGLGRRFGDQWAVRDMTLDVRRGEVLGLLGPNGAGKTTTVRMLAALIGPTEGRASVDGFDVVAEPDAVRSRVGILTETSGLYDKLSAERNLDYFGRLYRLPAAVRAERIERWLRLFGIWDRRGDPAGTLSKGTKQKLAIARALLHEPSVLFLDEPTAALDPEAAFIVREAITTLRGRGRTIVLCTHNLDEADRMCDRICFLRGTILRVDAPARLRGELGRGRVTIRLADRPTPRLLDALRRVSSVSGLDAADTSLLVEIDGGEPAIPAVVRAIVDAGGDVVEVRPAAATLEQVYFEVMGVHPGADGVGADQASGETAVPATGSAA